MLTISPEAPRDLINFNLSNINVVLKNYLIKTSHLQETHSNVPVQCEDVIKLHL